MGLNKRIKRIWKKSPESWGNLGKVGITDAECDCFRSGNFAASFANPDGNLFNVDIPINFNLQRFYSGSTERYCKDWKFQSGSI